MKIYIAVLAMLAAVGIGVALQPAARHGKDMTSRQAAAAWAASTGLIIETEHEFTNANNYIAFDLRAANDCRLTVIPLGRADEILPTLHVDVDEQKWEESRLLLGKVEPMPKTALGVQFRRLLARLTLGHAPQAVMLIAPPSCIHESFLMSLPEWPAP